MKNDKQQPEITITSNELGFFNDLRVFDYKDNILKNWTGVAVLGFCMYDDNEGYQEWNVTNTPDRDKNNGYRVRECYVAVSAPLSNETKVVQSVLVKTAEEIALDKILLFGKLSPSTQKQIFEAIETYASQLKNTDAVNTMLHHLTDEELLMSMQQYARQRSTDAVKVITDRIAELELLISENNNPYSTTWEVVMLSEANKILKLIQP